MSLPEMTIDMDGVLCRPALWLNLIISRDVRNAPDPTAVRPIRHPSGAFHWLDGKVGQGLRYGWRRPMPRVAEGLAELAESRRLILLSGRPHTSRGTTERWLIHNHFRDYFSEIILNDRGLPNAAFKLAIARERNILHHVDDDGRVAYFLTKDEPRTVFLIDWPQNKGLPYPKHVVRVSNLVEAAREARRLQGASPT